MKKILCLLLSLVTLFSLAACESGGTDAPEGKSVKGDKTCSYSEDLIILATYLPGTGYTYKDIIYTLKNNSNDTILDYSIAFLAFDLNGNVTKINGAYGDKRYAEKKVTMANILPGGVYGLGESMSDAKHYLGSDNTIRYIESVITHIAFKDGDVWDLEDPELWVDETVSNFSVEEHKNQSESLKTDAKKASVNPYVSVSESDLSLSSNPIGARMETYGYTLKCGFINEGEKPIRTVSIIVTGYDAQNNPAELSSSYVTSNSRGFILNCENFTPGEENYGEWENAISKNCDNIKIIVESIEFEDDTVWTNEYALQYMMYSESVYPEF